MPRMKFSSAPISFSVFAAFLTIATFLSSCSQFEKGKTDSGEGRGAAASSYAMTVSKDADLPECKAEIEEQLAFSVESKKFFLCLGTAWQEVVGPGENGKAGEPGSNSMIAVKDLGSGCKELLSGSDSNSNGKLDAKDKGYHREVLCNIDGENLSAAAFNLYEQFRRSVYRINVQCAYTGGTFATHAGSGFRCAEDKVCTAAHVLACHNGTIAGSISSLAIRHVENGADSDTESHVLFTTNTPDVEKATDCADITNAVVPDSGGDYCIDLGRVVVPAAQFAADMVVMPLTASKPSAGCATGAADCEVFPKALTPVLSLSFPLGFEELYSDLGHVNTNHIDECDSGRFSCEWLDFSTTNDTDGGSSGSPILSVATGEVVGVLVSGTTNEEVANYSWSIGAWMFAETF